MDNLEKIRELDNRSKYTTGSGVVDDILGMFNKPGKTHTVRR